MASSPPPPRKARLLFAGGVALVVALTLGMTVRGLYRSAGDAGIPGAPGAGGAGALAATAPGPGAPPTAAPARPAPAQAASSIPPQKPDPTGPQSRAAAFEVKRVLPVKGPFRHGDYVWDDKGVPAGPVVITVDLKAQTLSVFRDGYEIGTAVILYGATDKPSPLGVFPILQKDADHHSSTYYNAPMPYTLRLTADGVAIHGSNVVYGDGTHGCIGVPTPFARKLFGVAKLGDPVIITNGKMLKLN